MRTILLNTSIVTSYGIFEYMPSTLNEVGNLFTCSECSGGVHPCITCGGIGVITPDSAIGHESTAQILTDLLGFTVPVNRQEYRQEVGDVAVVFKLNGRPPEGKILSRQELEDIGFTFGILRRTK